MIQVMLLLGHPVVDHDGRRHLGISRQLHFDPRRLEQSARPVAPVARDLRFGNRCAGNAARTDEAGSQSQSIVN